MLSPAIEQDHNTVPEHAACRIVFVHGRKPKPPTDRYRPALFRCLVEGVRRADPDIAGAMSRNEACFYLARWSDLFYASARDFEQDRQAIERLLEQSGPTRADIAEARSLGRRFKRVLYSVGDRFPGLVERFADAWIRETLADTRRYLENRNGLGAAVRQRLAAELQRAAHGADQLTIIGHSLGAVAVFDTLWELTHVQQRPLPVDRFVTLGSPLGTRFIQRALLGRDRQGRERYPHGIRHWINFTAVGDLAALDPSVEDDFAPMIHMGLLDSLADSDEELYGGFRGQAGLNVHRSYSYLVQPAVGRVLADWWRASGCGPDSAEGD